jgi:hypothetical protein
MLTGTEAEIINSIARLEEATKNQISREVGFSSEYVGFLCRILVRKGYLVLRNGRYCLAKAGIKTELTEEPKIDKGLTKKIADEVVKEIGSQLQERVGKIKIPAQVKIKTDFESPVEDESLLLESNINKIGAKVEKEKSNIDWLIQLFRKIKKKGGRDD